MKPKISEANQFFQRAFMAHQAGRLGEAETEYRKALQHTPADMETLYLLGTVCSQLGKEDDAVKYLKMSLEIKPSHPEALNNLGLTLNRMHRHKEAATYYQRALTLKPDYADALNNFGSTLKLLGRLDEAEPYLRRALQLSPDFPDNHLNLIEAHLKWDDPVSAQIEAQKLQQLWPDARKKFTGEDWKSSWVDWDNRWKDIQSKQCHKKYTFC